MSVGILAVLANYAYLVCGVEEFLQMEFLQVVILTNYLLQEENLQRVTHFSIKRKKRKMWNFSILNFFIDVLFTS